MEEYDGRIQNLRMWKKKSAEEQRLYMAWWNLRNAACPSLLTDQRFHGKLTQLKHYMYLQLNIYKYIDIQNKRQYKRQSLRKLNMLVYTFTSG